jgi:ABC-type lipoprotein release transport system permease subunit
VLLVAIAGAAGGVTLAAVAGARRTESSYLRLVEAEDPGDVFMFGQDELDADDLAALRSIPGAEVSASTIVLLSGPDSGLARGSDFGVIVAADAASLEQTRPHHLAGRLPSPEHPDEIVVNERVARQLDVGPGDTVELVGPTEAGIACVQTLQCDGDLLADPVRAKVSGVSRRADDLDPDAFNGALTFAGPGFLDILPPGYQRAVTVLDVDLDRGSEGVDDFVAAVQARWPERFGIEPFDPANTDLSGTLDLESRSLLVFAAFAGLGGLVAALQAFARHQAGGRPDRRVLAALGVTTPVRALVALRTGVLVAAGATVLAVVVAIGASSFLPVGIAGQLEPHRGTDIDGVVLVAGGLSMLGLLTAGFALIVWGAVRRDPTDDPRSAGGRRLRLSLPVVADMGIELAMPRLRRSGWASGVGAIVATALATATAVAAIVIVKSEDGLQHDPERYGQPWDAIVTTTPDRADELASTMEHRPAVAALALAASGTASLSDDDGAPVEAYAVGFELREGVMEPTILDGRAPRTTDEVALGSDLFATLGVRIGDQVETTPGGTAEVVGRASVPIVGGDFPDDGVLFTMEGFQRHASRDVEGEEAEVGVAFDVPEGADLDQILARDLGPAVALAGVPARTPSRVTTLADIGRFPTAVALFIGALAVAALLHALLVIVRSRRHDLATLRALGLRRRQAVATVVCGAITLVTVGVVVGIPLGIALGRLIWLGTTGAINVVFVPVVPPGTIVAVVGAASVAAAIAVAWPVWQVARMRLADALRVE